MRWAEGMRPRVKGKPDACAVSLLNYLAQKADDRGESYRSEDTLRERLCLGRQAFRDRKAALIEQGYVEVTRRTICEGPRKGQRTSDRWRLRLDRTADGPARKDQPVNLRGEADDRRPAAGSQEAPDDQPPDPDPQTGDRTLSQGPAAGLGSTSSQEVPESGRYQRKNRPAAAGHYKEASEDSRLPPSRPAAGTRNTALVARYFEECAAFHHPGDGRAATLGSALTRRLTTWRDRNRIDVDDLVSAIDIFFMTQGYQRPDGAFWKTFLSNIDALLEKVRRRPLEDESWHDRQLRIARVDLDALARQQAEREKAQAEWKAGEPERQAERDAAAQRTRRQQEAH